MNLDAEIRQRCIHIEHKLDLLREEISRPHPLRADEIDHSDQWFGGRTYAQHGDDLITLCLFRQLGITYPTYIDIGAHHPQVISNTALMYARGCRGINIEANPNLFKEFPISRPEDINLNIGIGRHAAVLPFYMIDERSGRNSFSKHIVEEFLSVNPQFTLQKVIDIPIRSLTSVIAEYCNGIFPDFLTIDVEGYDFEILESTDFSITRPKIICVEVSTGNDTDTGNVMKDMLKDKGFSPVIRAGSNLMLVDAHLQARLGL